MTTGDLGPVYDALNQVRAGVRAVNAGLNSLKTDQQGLRTAFADLERGIARLDRILVGDPTVRHKGLIKEFEELSAEHTSLKGRVTAIEDGKTAEKNRIEGMRVVLGALGGATGVSIIAQIFQLYQATKAP